MGRKDTIRPEPCGEVRDDTSRPQGCQTGLPSAGPALPPEDTTLPTLPSTPLDDATVASLPKRAPERLGPFDLERKLGRGGMGTVYSAVLTEPRAYGAVGDRFAVKVLHPTLIDDRESVERFQREGELGCALSHPCLVMTHETATHVVNGTPFHYIVLDLVEGRTLRQAQADLGRIPETLLRHVAAQVARALEAMHAVGVIHRDVKPSNVIMTPDHHVKLMDLGIARLAVGAPDVTHAGAFVGSPLYAAPEQLVGATLGPATDLYSLGVTLMEAATGTNPFAAGEFHEVARRHVEEPAPRAGDLEPQISPFFEEIVAWLLEKDPRRRPASASELAATVDEGEASQWWQARQTELQQRDPQGALRRIRVPSAAPLVGRGAEHELLRGLAESARQGRGRVVLLEGEAGIGKTRLLGEFVRELELSAEPFNIVYGSHHPAGAGGGLGALAQAVVDHLGEWRLESRLARYLGAAQGLAPVLLGALGRGGTATGAGTNPAPGADALHAAFCHLARGLASERPTCWIVEDLHHAGPEARSLLLSLARIAGGERLLLVLTSRPELSAEELARLERVEGFERLPLSRLSQDDVRILVGAVLSSEDIADRIAGRIAARSDGNPFFALEILREMQEAGRLERGPDGTVVARGDISQFDVPSSVRSLLLGRLDGLDRRDRDLLDACAVQGFGFDPDLAARVLHRERLDVLQALAEMERRRAVVRAVGAGSQFDQHQLQEVLYRSLSPLLRAEYHARTAEEAAARGGFSGRPPEEVPGEMAAFTCEHFLRGGRRDEGLGLVRRAIEHLAARFANDACLDLVGLALELVQGDHVLRCDLRLEQRMRLNLLGRRAEERAAAEDAVAAAEAAGDHTRIARSLAYLAQTLMLQSDLVAALSAAERAIAAATECGDDAVVALAEGETGNVLIMAGRGAEAHAHYLRQLEIAPRLGARAEGRALMDLGVWAFSLGRFTEAKASLEASLERFRSVGDRFAEARAVGNLAGTLERTEGGDAARTMMERHVALSRELGDRRGEAVGTANLGTVEHRCGNLVEARVLMERSVSLYREIGYPRGEALSLLNVAWVTQEEGRLDLAESLGVQGIELARRVGARPLEAFGNLHAAEIARWRGLPDRAREAAARAVEAFRAMGAEEGLAHGTLTLGRILLETGDIVSAIPLFEESEALADRLGLGDPGSLPSAYLALCGRRDAGAVAIPTSAGLLQQAETHVVLARAGAGADHVVAARALLERHGRHLVGADRERYWMTLPVAVQLREIEAG